MESKPQLIIITPCQYGYQTDYLYYMKYLPEYFSVKLICLNQGKKKFHNNNISITYLPAFHPKQLAYGLFFIYALCYIIFHKGVVMCSNFGGCRWLKRLLPWRKMAVNIRTVSVNPNPIKAKLENDNINKDVTPFDKIIMISTGGAKQLCLDMSKVSIVSLGADVISNRQKTYDKIRLLYVGTFNGRRLLDTLIGINLFCKKYPNESITYDIIGDGEDNEKILHYIEDNKLQNLIKLHGRLAFDELKPYFDLCNVGISYVPITDYYQYQPPTKTFEYINSGLFCIATATEANKEVINQDNGILIEDTADAFCQSLEKIVTMRNSIAESAIRKSGETYSWKNIVTLQLINALNF